MDIDKIANLIKTKRKEKGLTQEELANRLNVTEKAISRWETGRGLPDVSLLVSLSEELGVSVSEILKGVEDKKEDKNVKEIVDYIDASKKNKNNKVIIISSIMYGILIFLYLCYLKVEYSVYSRFSYLGELIIYAITFSTVFLNNRYIANNYYDTIDDKERLNKITYIIGFILYVIMIFNLTIFGRDKLGVGVSYNLVPFKTLLSYWAHPSPYNTLVNVIGNIVVMIPIQYFIVRILDIKKFSTCFIIDLVFIFTIEYLQFIGKVGIFDIDDVILNLFGMTLMYALLMGKHRLLSKYKIFLITSLVSLLLVLFIFHILSWYEFPSIPTILVLFRLVFAYLFVEIFIYYIYKLKH